MSYRRFLAGALALEPSQVYVVLRLLEFPDGADRKVSFADLRWSVVRDLLELAEEVPIEPPSQRRAWLELILSSNAGLVFPYPVYREHLGGHLSAWMSLRWGLRELVQAMYGVFLEGSVGRVWAIPEGLHHPRRTFLPLTS